MTRALRMRVRKRPGRINFLASPAAVLQAPPPPDDVRILGLDPGSLITGYAVLECVGASTRYVASGAIRTTSDHFPRRLAEIFEGVAKLTTLYQPEEIAIERAFMHKNADSALKLGQARGAALCATFAAQPRIYEYAPREVKLAVVGTGSAQKKQVQLMVKHLLKLEGSIGPDAADALAMALCHAHSRRLQSFVSRTAGVS